jgi:hypothetical protein
MKVESLNKKQGDIEKRGTDDRGGRRKRSR